MSPFVNIVNPMSPFVNIVNPMSPFVNIVNPMSPFVNIVTVNQLIPKMLEKYNVKVKSS